MTWQTVEHLTTPDEALDLIKLRLDDNWLLSDIEDRFGVSDMDTIAEGVFNQISGIEGQFTHMTAEAIDALPLQVYQDLIASEFGDDISVQDTVARAFTATDQLNGHVFTYQEAKEVLPYFEMTHPTVITDDYGQLPLIVTVHTGEMNKAQEAYNNLSEEQRQFLATATSSLGQPFVVDSQETFSRHEYKDSNLDMLDPHGMRDVWELASILSDTENLQKDIVSGQLL